MDQQSYEEFLYSDTEHRYFSEIGSDVWIGARVTILGGVRIGHGAVIATGSVVTKDVDPYSIVGGVPAKHIRHRFDEGQRKAILQDPWWDKDEVWIQANLNLFTDKGAT
ncbi:MAG: CatB-related O-acetyltransferase [Lentimonas sp.]